jgi:cytochrome c-type biogenesis protein CcmH/NrfG
MEIRMSTQAQTKSTNRPVSRQQTLPDRIKDSEALNQAIDQVRTSVRANPEAAALWCLGIGFVLGWKLKPW